VVPYTGLGRIIGVIAMISAILFASLVTSTTTTALLKQFRAERDKVTKASKEKIGHVIAQLPSSWSKLQMPLSKTQIEKAKGKMHAQKNRSKSISKMIRRPTEQSAGAPEYDG